MMMLILQKEMLISAVTRKRNARNPETREKTLEAVESAERAGVSPDFAVFVSLYPDCVVGRHGLWKGWRQARARETYLRAQGSLFA